MPLRISTDIRLMSSAYSNSPHYSTLGLHFCWRVCLAQIHHLPASMLSRGFIFQAQALHSVAAEPDQKRHAYCTIRKGPCWNLQRWHRRGPAHLIPARCAGHPARFRSFGMLSGSKFSGSFGPMQRDAEPRCRGAPNGSCITQIIGVR
jgi:hypothetical protein